MLKIINTLVILAFMVGLHFLFKDFEKFEKLVKKYYKFIIFIFIYIMFQLYMLNKLCDGINI
jgi:amino acid permease